MAKSMFHMRLVAYSFDPIKVNQHTVESEPVVALPVPVAIDVILRGNCEDSDLEPLMQHIRSWLDGGAGIRGDWAGLGMGEFITGPVTLA